MSKDLSPGDLPPEVIGSMILDAPDVISDRELMEIVLRKGSKKNAEKIFEKGNQDLE